ncbi:TMEM175 family protein [Niveispirillum sp. KHB5.9]|uniref:TMEM175 family protein n=1 Tax=Niveispirillum sp. KHB5.9 TaxID=3400269 RepID=UPI003A8BDC98
MSDSNADPGSTRLDNFVDAAFAFAVSLLVIAEGGSEFGFRDLLEALWRLPVFAGGFVLIAMFWWAHVSWRRAGGRGDGLSVLLSLALVFVVMVYVYPMRVMLLTFTEFLRGRASLGLGDARALFVLYGAGFALMSGLILALFTHGLRRGHLVAGHWDHALVWALIMGSGILSALLAAVPSPGAILVAPWSYSLLPLAIPLALRVSAKRRARQAAESGSP